MRSLLLVALAALSLATAASAGDQVVSGYTRKDGTYVAPYHRSTPNSTTTDNYSTTGNYNPYTGVAGTKPDTRPSGYTVPAYKPYEAPKATNPYGSPYGTAPKPACTTLYGC